jgi:outer membrane murein-binding lipoprotein Lpp
VLRRTFWVLAALWLLVPAAARALEIKEELTPDEIRKEFRKIVSEFSEIERNKRSANFHINQLETNVRELSGKLDALDTRLKLFESAIEGLRADLARMAKAKTEEAKAAPPAAGTAPANPAAVQEAIARIEDEKHTIEGTFLTFTGTVVNLVNRPLIGPTVKVSLYGDKGILITAQPGFTSPQIIPPMGKATYRIIIRRDERVKNSSVRVHAE